MIVFKINDLVVKRVLLRSITGLQEGKLVYINPVTKTEQAVPTTGQALRLFRKLYPQRTFLNAMYADVVLLNGMAVCIERQPILTTDFNPTTWKSNVGEGIAALRENMDSSGEQWYTDGTYAYTIPYSAISDARMLSTDSRFREVPVTAFPFVRLIRDEFTTQQRVCLSFHTDAGPYGITPPIWQTLSAIGLRQIENGEVRSYDIEDDSCEMFTQGDSDVFDRIDQHLAVNLSFAIKAARDIADMFGYNAIEPLNLPNLMLELKTVNLPNIAKPIKETFDIGIPFTHMVAWLIGLLSHTKKTEDYIKIRGLLKYLTTKGVYRKNAFVGERIFQPNKSVNDIPLKEVQQVRDLPTTALSSTIREHYHDEVIDIINSRPTMLEEA